MLGLSVFYCIPTHIIILIKVKSGTGVRFGFDQDPQTQNAE